MRIETCEAFKACIGCITYNEAVSKFERAFRGWALHELPVHMIVQRRDGQFIPVAILGSYSMRWAHTLSSMGLYCASTV